MRVGELLNKDIEEIPSLKYTLRVRNSFENNFTSQERMESDIYLNNCNFFINCRKNSNIKSFSFSANKSKKQQPFNKIIIDIQNNNPRTRNEKFLDKDNLYNKFPEIKEKKITIKKHLSSKKTKHFYLKTFPDSEMNENKEIVKKFESGRNLSINHIKNKILFENNKKLFVDYNDDKKANIQKLFNLRIERRFKIINKITNKLNKPLFLLTSLDKIIESNAGNLKIYNKVYDF